MILSRSFGSCVVVRKALPRERLELQYCTCKASDFGGGTDEVLLLRRQKSV